MITLPSSSRVVIGNAFSILSLEPHHSADAGIIDPPYNIGLAAWDRLGGPTAYQAWCGRWGAALLPVLKPGAFLLSFGATRTIHRMAVALEDAGYEIRDLIGWAYAEGLPKNRATLKPGWDPILVCRKPLDGTLAENLNRWGTGDLNIDEARLPYADAADLAGAQAFSAFRQRGLDRQAVQKRTYKAKSAGCSGRVDPRGRWPANVIWSDALDPNYDKFFVVPKARPERGWRHPTGKPLALMEHLVRLVSRKGQTVIDCFSGGAATLVACQRLQRRFVGIELSRDFAEQGLRRLLQAGAQFGPNDGVPACYTPPTQPEAP